MRSHRLLFAALLLVAGPAAAQLRPAAPLAPSGEQSRSFSLKNTSQHAVTRADAHMTDGQTRKLTDDRLQPQQSRQIVVPRSECLDSIDVSLDNGRSLRAENLNDCRDTQIVVTDNGIDTGSNLNPRSRGNAPTH